MFFVQDGRIKAGDQILEVDGNNIVGLDRDEYVFQKSFFKPLTKFKWKNSLKPAQRIQEKNHLYLLKIAKIQVAFTKYNCYRE